MFNPSFKLSEPQSDLQTDPSQDGVRASTLAIQSKVTRPCHIPKASLPLRSTHLTLVSFISSTWDSHHLTFSNPHSPWVAPFPFSKPENSQRIMCAATPMSHVHDHTTSFALIRQPNIRQHIRNLSFLSRRFLLAIGGGVVAGVYVRCPYLAMLCGPPLFHASSSVHYDVSAIRYLGKIWCAENAGSWLGEKLIYHISRQCPRECQHKVMIFTEHNSAYRSRHHDRPRGLWCNIRLTVVPHHFLRSLLFSALSFLGFGKYNVPVGVLRGLAMIFAHQLIIILTHCHLYRLLLYTFFHHLISYCRGYLYPFYAVFWYWMTLVCHRYLVHCISLIHWHDSFHNIYFDPLAKITYDD